MYDDWEIWEQIRQGDTQALKMLHNRYFSQMNLYARKIAGDHYPAEEIVSDCFIKLWTRRSKNFPRSAITPGMEMAFRERFSPGESDLVTKN